jgi:RNA polymerase sigma factor (sigma-70 family)
LPAPDSGPPAAAPTDAELLAAVRAGDTSAFGVLYDRHCQAARRLAQVLMRDPSDAEDLVAEAVAKVLSALRGGRGPEMAFRAYLLTAVRHAGYDRVRRDRRLELTGDLSRFEPPGGSGGGASEPTMAGLERSYAARAFAKLPDRWRMVLWHTEVEGEKPATIAVMLGLSPNAVAALAYRARERLRQMYLQEHLTAIGDPACHWTADRLGAHVRGGLAGRERSKVDSHLAACGACRQRQAELAEVNSSLRGVLGPVVLGTAATPYLSTLPSATWWAGLTAGSRALARAFRRWWSSLAGWCRWQARQYGPGDVAAGLGGTASALVGVGLLLLALGFEPIGPGSPDQPAGPPPAAVGPPVPVPGPDLSPSRPGGGQPTGGQPTDGPATGDRTAPEPPPEQRPAAVAPGPPGPAPPPAGQPAPTRPAAPEPPGPARPPAPAVDRIGVAPDLSATHLSAAAAGELAIEVDLPGPAGPGTAESATAESATAESSRPAARPGPATESVRRLGSAAPAGRAPSVPAGGQVELVVEWPEGIALAGADAGDGWRCTATGGRATCRRPAWPGRESRTARLPVRVAGTLGGYAPVEVAVTAGQLRGTARVRVPVAPAGLRVGYAATGRYRLAMAGNTWLSCPARRECLATDPLDNNLVPMVPYRPGAGEPAPPPGLTGPVAASGAAVAVPAGAEVTWAALHWASTGTELPELVQVSGPGGDRWHPVRADETRSGEGTPVRQAYADVTGLVRAAGRGGTWWLATRESGLPAGRGAASAGWSLTVVYADPDAPRRDLAVFADPVLLSDARDLSVTASAPGGEVEVGLVGWEGDRTLTGDGLALDGRPLGDPDNLAASRAAGALECGDTPPEACRWHTFGVDVARHQGRAGTGPDGGTVTLRAGQDRMQLGVLALAVGEPR